MNSHRNSLSALVATALLATASLAQAASVPKRVDDARLQYERERADCMMGRTNEPKSTCLREAAAAYAQARQGRLITHPESPDQLMANALKRCEVQKGDDRDMCERRVRGEGQVDGGVSSGGQVNTLTVRTVDIPKSPG
ncbi:MAG: hypothetical protein JF607_26410 [Burkholderiales bacterium]|nr:hypothetical protein [Burkholderiales bacterium]